MAPPPPPPPVLLGDKLGVGEASNWSSPDDAEVISEEWMLLEAGGLEYALGVDAEDVILPGGSFESVLGDVEIEGNTEAGNDVLWESSSRSTAPVGELKDAEALETLAECPPVVDPDGKEMTGTKEEGAEFDEVVGTEGVTTTLRTGGSEANIVDDPEVGSDFETLGLVVLSDGSNTEIEPEDVLEADMESVETDVTTRAGALEEELDIDEIEDPGAENEGVVGVDVVGDELKELSVLTLIG